MARPISSLWKGQQQPGHYKHCGVSKSTIVTRMAWYKQYKGRERGGKMAAQGRAVPRGSHQTQCACLERLVGHRTSPKHPKSSLLCKTELTSVFGVAAKAHLSSSFSAVTPHIAVPKALVCLSQRTLCKGGLDSQTTLRQALPC